ncbi:MAG: DUF4365 domain-containing protein [Nitrososphaera sp.]|nr:DUF4365 domain-containing protein [Nitrososphaera sp.]
MITVGITDAFERHYMQKFRLFAATFGEFVTYERDRGARDIGLHLTHKRRSGKERLSTALCWFQMKGIMKSSLSAKAFADVKEVKIALNVEHLRYWYLQPVPTYLVVYIESVDTFLVMNVQEYVAKEWGKGILSLKKKTTSVSVPTESVLDAQAFHLILVKGDIGEWSKALDADATSVRLCRRDYDLIWHLGTAKKRGVSHRIVFLDYQSKTRSQLLIQERSNGANEWESIRDHWQYMMNIVDLPEAYPYIEFFSLDEGSISSWLLDDDVSSDAPDLVLSNGEVIRGTNCSFEYFEYTMGCRLNKLGRNLFKSVSILADVGLVEITSGKQEFISVAPWHNRAV